MQNDLKKRIAAVRVESWDQSIGMDGAAAILRDIPELTALSHSGAGGDVTEQAAKVLCEKNGDLWADFPENGKEAYRDDARALAAAGLLSAPTQSSDGEKTADELRIAEVERRVWASSLGDECQISTDDFRRLLASRLAWKETAKCYCTLASQSDAGKFDGTGFVYSNPDTGEEYASDHPIESGEVTDATDIRQSTAMEDVLNARVQELFQENEKLKSTPSQSDAGVMREAIKALDHAKEYFETLNDFFGCRERGLTPDNKESAMFERVHFILGTYVDPALEKLRTLSLPASPGNGGEG